VKALAYRGGQRGRVAPGGTSEGAAFSEKCENLLKMVKFTKNGKIYVKNGTILSIKTDKRAEN